MIVAVIAASATMSFAKCADVEVSDSFWSHRFELWRTVTIPDIFSKFEKRSFALRNFDRAAAGRREGHYGCDFYDGVLLEAVRGASDYLSRYPSRELDALLDGVVDRVVAAQMPDGYLHTGVQIKAPEHRWGDNGGCALSQHEIYNAGCLIEAGVHHYRATGKTKLLACALKFANLLCDTIGPLPKRNLIPTHSLAEEAMVELARLTREDPRAAAAGGVRARPDDYLSLVRFWFESHGNNCGVPDWERLGVGGGCAEVRRMTSVAHTPDWRPSWGDYQMDRRPLGGYESIEGHAVRATLLCSGLAAFAAETGDAAYAVLAKRFWESMVGCKEAITGGVGTEAARENFGGDYDLPPDAYLETCAAIGNAFFSANLAALTGDGRYMDEFERVIYNALLVEVSEDGRHYTYCNPLNTDKGVRFDWHGVPCCPPMFLKLTGALPGYVYAKGEGGYYVNLFMGGSTSFADAAAGRVALAQQTKYPMDGVVDIGVNPERPADFALRVRVPGWARGVENPFGLYTSDFAGKWSVSVNGKPTQPKLERGYQVIRRRWKRGDIVRLQLDVSPRRIRACEQVKVLLGRAAEARGPVVYAEERGKTLPFYSVANHGEVPHAVWRVTPPADFMSYWQGERKRLRREVPIDVQKKLLDDRSTNRWNVYSISFATFGGKRLHGYMSVPKKRSGKLPVFFNVPGAGPGVCDCSRKENGISVAMNVHGYEQPEKDGMGKRFDEWRRDLLARWKDVGHFAHTGITGSRDDYFFHDVILGIDRAMDWAATQPEANGDVLYSGSSQGGGFGIILAALNPRVKRLAAHVPAMTDILGCRAGRTSGWPKLTEGMKTPELRMAAEKIAPYYDAVNFATFVTCPARFSVGMKDPVVPHTAVRLAFEALGSNDKQLLVGEEMTHNVFFEFYRRTDKWLEEAVSQ
ncbi:MAG: glycoside hydrolase family 127 protein [Kiritimatiellae bacterium]|nr:glycoside hydrolase family 127 protein [Kiritimatiellia bacterium]